ncbi:MAG TPA: hypothetical protein VHM20_05040 [Gammaproteobacteria bacterium]|nr:hypothetical protein [Gammaproteobacteria bacterium]
MLVGDNSKANINDKPSDKKTINSPVDFVLNTMHQALKKAQQSKNPEYIFSGLYGCYYCNDRDCINRIFLINFADAIVKNVNLIQTIANVW